MIIRLIPVIFFILNFAPLISQVLAEKDLMGKWLVTHVEIHNDNPKHKEGIDFLKKGYTGSIFHFKGNGIFQMTYSENANPLIEEFNPTGENWTINNEFIDIGMEKQNFTSMRILPAISEGKTYFQLPMMRLEVKKIKSEKARKRKLGKSAMQKTVEAQYNDTKPIELITRDLSEEMVFPFPETDTPPLPAACASMIDIEEARKCVSMQVQKHVQRKFNVELAYNEGLSGRIRIEVNFIIDKDGQVINIEADGPSEAINDSAVNAVASLPNFVAGIKDGVPVPVSYKLPIIFEVH